MYIIKQCTKCKEYKLLEDFCIRKACAFGKDSQCKLCKKQYQQENKERIKQYKKQYWQENKEKIRQYNQRRKEQIKQYRKQYWQENKEYFYKYAKQKKQTDPLFKMSCNIRCLIYHSIKKQGYTKSSKTYKILGCDFNTFKKHIERQFTKGMTWENHGEWHYDHIIPISSAQTEEEVIKLNHYTNFQPLWAEDNIRKSNKIEPTQIKLRI